MEKLTIEQIIEKEMTPRTMRFWGFDYENFTPALAQKQHGDGRRLMWFTPLNTRPNYYIIRVDSQLPIGDDDESQDAVRDFIGAELIDALEDEFGSRDWDDDSDNPDTDWPVADIFSIGFSWGFFDEYGNG